MARWSTGEKAVEYLKKNPEKKFTAREIAEAIYEDNKEACEKKRNESIQKFNTKAAFINQLSAEINPKELREKYDGLRTIEDRPRKLYWTGKSEEQEVKEAEKSEAHPKTSSQNKVEHGLYNPLREYLRSELGVYSMRVDETKSVKPRSSVSNKWLHPDIVGIENLIDGWKSEIIELTEIIANRKAEKKSRLWSLEVKPLLNGYNVREAFFQTVANSSWANFGYLAGIIEGDNTIIELRRLANLHGIGVIAINKDSPTESRILVPAQERNDIDLANCNRLAEVNEDFFNFIKEVRSFYLTGEIHQDTWEIPKD